MATALDQLETPLDALTPEGETDRHRVQHGTDRTVAVRRGIALAVTALFVTASFQAGGWPVLRHPATVPPTEAEAAVPASATILDADLRFEPRPVAAPLLAVSAPMAAPAAAPAPALAPRHLPRWVQVQHQATVWASPSEDETRKLGALPAWTFLEVLGVQHDRLQVRYAPDGGTAGAATGWVGVREVQPSDPSGAWLRNHRETRLFAAADGQAVQSTLAQWTYLRALGEERDGRVRVAAYALDLKRTLGTGWVASQDVGPTGAPDRPVLTTPEPTPPPSAYRDQAQFIETVGQAARALHASTGVPASVTVAQAILESDWGDSLLTRQANNYFGMKAMGELGNDGAVWMRTLEYDDDGEPYYEMAPFRAYRSLADALADHNALFNRFPRYRPAMLVGGDPNEFARQIAAAGYSTDPAYPDKLIGLMEKYDLYRFDR